MGRGLWTHDAFMDVTMLVVKVQFRGPKYLKAKAEWFVRGQTLNIKQNVKLQNRDLVRWRPK